MKVACFIPIKKHSERVKGKNFRLLNGKKLYEYIITNVLEASVFDDIFVDTDSEEIKDYISDKEVSFIEREDWLVKNTANGNDLLISHANKKEGYDYYFQLFATAPFLSPDTISECVEILMSTDEHDSIFTGLHKKDFYWLNNNPVNYRPGLLPRSQDLDALVEETTGLYGIKKESLDKYHCRIGRKPYIYEVNYIEAVDINNEEDLEWAEWLAKKYDIN